jgi:hypothetical protein
MGLHFILGEGEAHAALGVRAEFLELALAATAGMDLAFHHPDRTAQLVGSSRGFVGRHDRDAFGDGSAEGLEKRLGLIFVDVHVIS